MQFFFAVPRPPGASIISLTCSLLMCASIARGAPAHSPATSPSTPAPTHTPTPAPTAAGDEQLFNFGAAGAGIRLVPGTPYRAARGYGFEPSRRPGEIDFSVRAVPGDYAVTVTLRAQSGGARVSLLAEERRLMSAPLVLAPGQHVVKTFVVNVRDATLEHVWSDPQDSAHVALRAEELRGGAWDDRLTVRLAGSTEALLSIAVRPVRARRILLAGDSTVASQTGGDAASWGQMVGRFLDPALALANHARNGETLKSFLTNLRWDRLMSDTQPGDVVLLQFGHNDEKTQYARTYSSADGAYPAFLAALVADVRQHRALPVLVTPVARRSFNAAGKIENSHAGYDAAVRITAAALAVPLIDLTTLTTQLYESMGPQNAALAFTNQGQDRTHHNAYGAYLIGCMVARQLSAIAPLAITVADDTPACGPTSFAGPAGYGLTASDWPDLQGGPSVLPEPAPTR
jgi:lysophospholipase L1-like esterase